jgi:hypothetical protein
MSPLPHRVRIDPSRYGPRSWAENHYFFLVVVITLVGFAAPGIVAFYKLPGWAAAILLVFSILAVYPWRGIWHVPRGDLRYRPINRANRWKYLTFLGVLWLIILPIAWWYAFRATGK